MTAERFRTYRKPFRSKKRKSRSISDLHPPTPGLRCCLDLCFLDLKGPETSCRFQICIVAFFFIDESDHQGIPRRVSENQIFNSFVLNQLWICCGRQKVARGPFLLYNSIYLRNMVMGGYTPWEHICGRFDFELRFALRASVLEILAKTCFST